MDRARWPHAGQRITIEPWRRLHSAGFYGRPPSIANIGLIGPDVRAAMNECWQQHWFADRAIDVFRIPDAYVVGDGLILDRELRVVLNASVPCTDAEIGRGINDVQSAETEQTVVRYDYTTILSKGRGPYNYGHFLLEALPMAQAGADTVGERTSRFLVQRVPPACQDVMLRAFRLMGVTLDRLLVQCERTPIFFEDLVVVRGLVEAGTYLSPLCTQALETMAQRADLLAPSYMPGRYRDKIFVKGLPSWRRGRNLLNEEGMSHRLRAAGYTPVEPSGMSLEQQIRVFRDARCVVGPIGTAMSNIAFCKEGTLVTLLCPASLADTSFWFIATHKRLMYREVRGDRATANGSTSWPTGFTIRDNDIAALETTSVPASW